MTPEFNKNEETAAGDATRRIGREAAAVGSEAVETEEKKTIFGSLRDSYLRARDGRARGPAEKQNRTAKNVDRSKGLLALAGAVVVMLFVFLGLFSSSSGTRDRAAHKTKPSLGRPEMAMAKAAENRGSVTPLLNADMSGQDGNSDQIGPDDVKATGRLHMGPQPAAAKTLGNVPPMDPALEAYRQAQAGYTVPQPPTLAANTPAPAPAPAPATPPARNEADALKKSSLVFVRNNSTASASAVRPASTVAAEPALLERRATALLPNGARLVARMQSTVSTAVKAPVVAAIEYNYERDGEIIIPAGTKAFGELQQANKNGDVSIRFHMLQMPDGTAEKINAGAMSLAYGPLRGSVSGSNAAKRILVRSITGIGTMAAYLVGGPGGLGGVNGQLDNSILLRERIASNAGMAGEQEMAGLAVSENLAISVPGNTRFFIVLLAASGEEAPAKTIPAGARGATQLAGNGASPLPSAEELRELIELKTELNRMYREVAATRTSAPTEPPQEQ
jgi:type IV secretory pathway VirB10-like protein